MKTKVIKANSDIFADVLYEVFNRGRQISI